jgi:hypothetical protein
MLGLNYFAMIGGKHDNPERQRMPIVDDKDTQHAIQTLQFM